MYNRDTVDDEEGAKEIDLTTMRHTRACVGMEEYRI